MSNHTLRSGIYQIRNNISGKLYIGQAQNIKVRWTEHIYHLNRGTHRNRYLQNAWRKDGESAFVFSVMEYCEIDLLNSHEQMHLDLFLPTGMCYNISKSAEAPTRGIKFSEESLQRMREAQKNQPPASEATKQKISQANKGRNPSTEARQRMSEAGKKRPPVTDATREKLSNIFKGRIVSEETRQKMSIAAKNRSEEHKRKIKEAANNRTEEHLRKIKEAALKRPPMSDETRKKMSQSHLARNARLRALKDNE